MHKTVALRSSSRGPHVGRKVPKNGNAGTVGVGLTLECWAMQGHKRVNRTNEEPVVIGGDGMFWPQLYGSQKV